MTFSYDAPYECSKCPRLRSFLDEKAVEYPDYFNGPVPSFGDPSAKLLIIGLAPGLHGANQTGRPFTGDWAGDLLYAAIGKYGFSNNRYAKHADDGLQLFDTMITNAVRCVPPQNKPVGLEIRTCRSFLKDQLRSMANVEVMLCLGKISHDSTVRALGLKLSEYPFGHHAKYTLPDGRVLISSYHCSRYNTNTKRLTEKMFYEVFADIRQMIG